MSAELQIQWNAGATVYFLVRNSTASIYNGSSFVAYVTADLGSYDIPASEQGTASGYYTANMPAVSAGVYSVVVKQQLGGSPSETDPTIGTGEIQWSGSAVIPLSSVPVTTSITTIVQSLLEYDVGNVENSAAVHSLATAILKLVSKFDGKLGLTYLTDGTTVKMTQAVTTDATMTPIRSLGVGA